MSATEAIGQMSASGQAVDEEYRKLERKFFVDRRRVVLVNYDQGTEGGFGIVRRAELHESAYLPTWLGSRQYGPPQSVAVKQIKISSVSNLPRVKRALTREMLVWSSLEAHPGIAKFLGFYADFKRSEAWLLSPWEPNGNISEFIKAHKLEVPEKLSLVYDTIDALAFLHQLDPPVCHGDIKSPNVLVSADYRARLCDFGLARLHEDSGFGRLETSTGSKGSIRWCSPELIDGAPRAPTSDVYAWAWLVWEIMTGNLPYEGTSADYAIIRKIFESPLSEADGQSRLSDCLQLWELMTRCWNVDPVQRPTARMCNTTVTYLPRCTPTRTNSTANHQTQSATLLENLGELESWKGNQEMSSAYLNEAMRLYQEEADTKGIASVLLKQAAAAQRISNFVKLRDIATTALEHCRALKDTRGIADASYYLGFSVWMLGEVGEADEALSLLGESLEIRRTHGDDVGIVQCLERIGGIQKYNGQMQEALSTLDEAVAIASRSGDRLGLSSALHIVGLTHLSLSNFVEASNALSKCTMIDRNLGLEGSVSISLRSMGHLKFQLGDYPEAERLYQESLSIARRIGVRYSAARTLDALGECLQRQSKFDEAASAWAESCLLWHELSQPRESREIASTLVELKSSQSDWDSALFWHDHIIFVCRSQKEYWEVADHLGKKGEILVKAQRYDEAAMHFEAAIATRGENGYHWHWQPVRSLCAIPKTAIKWERRSLPSRDEKKRQRRLPQLITAALKPPTPISHVQPYPYILD